LALVQSGLRQHLEGVVAIAKVDMQYMHVIVPRDSPVREFRDLAGRRVALGPVGSGYNDLSTRILGFYHLRPPIVRVNEEIPELVRDVKEGRVDAAIATPSLNTPFLDELLSSGDYRLVGVENNQAVEQYVPGTSAVQIPPGVYGPNRTMPVEP